MSLHKTSGFLSIETIRSFKNNMLRIDEHLIKCTPCPMEAIKPKELIKLKN
jgi:hypothetical protein